MKLLPIIIAAAFFLSGCSGDEIDAWGRAARGAADGYYGGQRTTVVQPVVAPPQPYYYGY